MSLELIGKFIGPDEIVSVEQVELKTPRGTDVCEVIFKSGRKHLFSKTTLDHVVTDEISDLNLVQEKNMVPMLNEMMQVLAEYDVRVEEVNTLFTKLGAVMYSEFDKARSFLWYGTSKEYVQGMDSEYGVSLLMAKDVLRKANGNEN